MVAPSTGKASSASSSKKTAAKSKPVDVKLKTASHPSTAAMVTHVLQVLNERGGSSLQAIKKMVSGTYKLDVEKVAPYIKRYVKQAVESGELIQTKGVGASGSFKLPPKSTSKAKADGKTKSAPKNKSTSPKKEKAEKTSKAKVSPKKVTSPKASATKKTASLPTKPKKSPIKPIAKSTKATPAAKPKSPKPKTMTKKAANPAKKTVTKK